MNVTYGSSANWQRDAPVSAFERSGHRPDKQGGTAESPSSLIGVGTFDLIRRCSVNNPSKTWPEYRPQEIEPRWQAQWEQTGLYLANETSDRPKYYCLDFFPYPSGDGLHVGHCRNYIPTDVMSRFQRMRGFNVLHPMGWDAFGEPSEQYAILHNIHPRQVTDQNTANFRRQLSLLGTSYDWSREIDSSRPEYYRWTQWFFLKMYRRGLAYRDHSWQWWCPTCQTTLSSHEVSDGVCWRGHSGVTRKKIPAWYFRITSYADELIAGLDEIDWPEAIKSMQRNWIGRSEGCEVIFQTPDGLLIPVFTTRPDTLYGVTFFALAPEHEVVLQIASPAQRAAVEEYLANASKQSEIERMQEDREKTGVFTGALRDQSPQPGICTGLGGGLCAPRLWDRGGDGRSCP